MERFLLWFLVILSGLLISIILIQPPQIDSLGDAFNGNRYISKSERNTTRLTYIFTILISFILILFQYLKFLY